MKRRFPVVAFATLLGVVMVTGCAGAGDAPTSVALSEAPGFPRDAPIQDPQADVEFSGEPVGWFSANGTSITIVSYGSSSCPYIASSVELVDADLVAIALEQAPGGGGCTDDLSPHTHVVAVPGGLETGAASAEVSLSLNAFGPVEPTVVRVSLLPPRANGVGEPPADTIALEVVRGTPDDIVLDGDDLDRGEPLAFWGEGRATIRVVTWGSSGCPPIARSLKTTAPDELALNFGPNPAEFCTADFAPTTHVLATPGDVAEGDVAEGDVAEGDVAGGDVVEGDITLAITIAQNSGPSGEYSVPVRG